MAERILLACSGGKDSAMALSELRGQPDIEIVGLLTTLTEPDDVISMHRVRRNLLEQQVGAIGLPLVPVSIPATCRNAVYEAAMEAALRPYLEEGLSGVAFGDIYLQDLRAYRESRLAAVGLRGLFPLWGRDTRRNVIMQGLLAGEFAVAGLLLVFQAHLLSSLHSLGTVSPNVKRPYKQGVLLALTAFCIADLAAAGSLLWLLGVDLFWIVVAISFLSLALLFVVSVSATLLLLRR